ncbi:MAG: TldD/PmbA family protein [Candidatus Nanoarchaeia archaeon]
MEAIIDSALKFAKNLKVDYAEVRAESSYGTSFYLANGLLQGSSFGEEKGISIRLLINNTIGFASTNILDEKNIKEIVKKAYAVALANKKQSEIRFSKEQIVKTSYEVKQKKALDETKPSEKISYLKMLDSIINISPHRQIAYSDEVCKKWFVNTEGTYIFSEIPRAELFYLFTLIDGEKTMQRMWDYGAVGGFEVVEKWNLQEVFKDEVNAILKILKEGENVPVGKTDLVVAPQVSGIIAHESCGHPFEADRIIGREAAQAGESWIDQTMIGNCLGKECVTIIDDPTIENSFGFFLYDDEGVKARAKELIKEGKINAFLHNRETSAALNHKNNGSARAKAFAYEPIVRMSNTFFKPGEFKEEELIEDIRKGVYFKSFMEWNIDDKRYNNKYVSAIAYLIENGKVTKPLKPVTLEITTPDLYAAIDAVGNNFELHAATCGKGEPMQGIPVTHGGGSLRLRKVMIK